MTRRRRGPRVVGEAGAGPAVLGAAGSGWTATVEGGSVSNTSVKSPGGTASGAGSPTTSVFAGSKLAEVSSTVTLSPSTWTESVLDFPLRRLRARIPSTTSKRRTKAKNTILRLGNHTDAREFAVPVSPPRARNRITCILTYENQPGLALPAKRPMSAKLPRSACPPILHESIHVSGFRRSRERRNPRRRCGRVDRQSSPVNGETRRVAAVA